MPSVILEPTTTRDIRAAFGTAPTREHVALNSPQSATHWFMWLAAGEHTPAGFGALMRVDSRTARLKALYVRPARRGRGIGAAGAQLLADLAAERGYLQVDQFAIAPAWWIAHGWTPLAPPLRNGAQHLAAPLPLPQRLT